MNTHIILNLELSDNLTDLPFGEVRVTQIGNTENATIELWEADERKYSTTVSMIDVICNPLEIHTNYKDLSFKDNTELSNTAVDLIETMVGSIENMDELKSEPYYNDLIRLKEQFEETFD